jgi:hypothetical protein
LPLHNSLRKIASLCLRQQFSRAEHSDPGPSTTPRRPCPWVDLALHAVGVHADRAVEDSAQFLLPPSSWGSVAKLPRLYGPRAPVIISMTSDCCAREPDNIRSLSGILRKPESSTFYNSRRINKGVTTTLQHLLQIFTSERERI